MHKIAEIDLSKLLRKIWCQHVTWDIPKWHHPLGITLMGQLHFKIWEINDDTFEQRMYQAFNWYQDHNCRSYRTVTIIIFIGLSRVSLENLPPCEMWPVTLFSCRYYLVIFCMRGLFNIQFAIFVSLLVVPMLLCTQVHWFPELCSNNSNV